MSRIADWPHLFGHIVTATGWTRREVEALTLRDANELLAYWSEHPPAHVLLAALMRARPLQKNSVAANNLMSAVTAVGGKVSSAPFAALEKILKSEHEGHKGFHEGHEG